LVAVFSLSSLPCMLDRFGTKANFVLCAMLLQMAGFLFSHIEW